MREKAEEEEGEGEEGGYDGDGDNEDDEIKLVFHSSNAEASSSSGSCLCQEGSSSEAGHQHEHRQGGSAQSCLVSSHFLVFFYHSSRPSFHFSSLLVEKERRACLTCAYRCLPYILPMMDSLSYGRFLFQKVRVSACREHVLT